jgi:predicted nucleic-acid-binding protein
MIGIDTNILLRFILADDPVQLEQIKAFLRDRSADDPAFISLFVLAETSWVLKRRFGYRNDIIARTVLHLLDVEEFLFEDEYFVDELLTKEANLAGDISDHVVAHLAARSGCSKTMTFDRKAAKSVPGMELLQ